MVGRPPRRRAGLSLPAPFPPSDRFDAFAGIDWSGQAVARPRGLALAVADRDGGAPVLHEPPGGWSRAGLLEWIAARGSGGDDMLIGIDLSMAFPHADHGAYFPGWHDTPPDAPALWAMVERLSADDPHLSASALPAHPVLARHFRQRGACGDLFQPGRGRLRRCEEAQRRAGFAPTSCFNLVGAAQVGKASLTGMRVLHRLRGCVPVWPFDPLPPRGPVIVEIYTTVAARAAGIAAGRSKIRTAPELALALERLGSAAGPPPRRVDDHATDAILSAAWLRRVAHRPGPWQPAEMDADTARTEGWTFGIE